MARFDRNSIWARNFRFERVRSGNSLIADIKKIWSKVRLRKSALGCVVSKKMTFFLRWEFKVATKVWNWFFVSGFASRLLSPASTRFFRKFSSLNKFRRSISSNFCVIAKNSFPVSLASIIEFRLL